MGVRSHCLGKILVQPVVGVTGEVTGLVKTSGPNLWWESPAKSLSWKKRRPNSDTGEVTVSIKNVPTRKKKRMVRPVVGVNSEVTVLEKQMVRPVVGVTIEVNVLDPLKRLHVLRDELTESIVSATVELSVDLGVLGVHNTSYGHRETSLATRRTYGIQKPGGGRKMRDMYN